MYCFAGYEAQNLQDTSKSYLELVLADAFPNPGQCPDYNDLPSELPPLGKGLPIAKEHLDAACDPFNRAEMLSLLVTTASEPAIMISSVVNLATFQPFSFEGEHMVVINTERLVSSLMTTALGVLNVPFVQAGNIVDKSGATTGMQRPDVLLFLQSALMFKV